MEPPTSSDEQNAAPGARRVRPASLFDALVPMAVLAASIAGSLALFGLDALDGPLQVALVFCSMVAGLVALKNGYAWADVQRAAQSSLASVTSAVFLLLAVGALIGVWNLSGTIPTLVSYGLEILSPTIFYAAAAVICGVVAMSIGSSWTTAGTVGVGLVGLAATLGVSPEITAGAVVSGAYLGDKTSPLSDTTILAAQVAGVDVREHIRHQLWTSVPAFVLAVAVFVVLGFVGPDVDDAVRTSVEVAALDEVFVITPLALLPLVLLGYLSIRGVPATLAIGFSTLFAGVLGAFLQPDVVQQFVGGDAGRVVGSLEAVWEAMATGFHVDSGVEQIDRLVSRGGMASMLPTVWLIIGAVTFGAIMDELGLLRPVIDPVLAAARTTGRLFLSVFACAVGLNVVAGDQIIALVLPVRLFRRAFAARGLAPTNLSRLAADCGTVTSPLVPWNACGAFMAAVLGVSTLSYLPYAVFNLASPLISVGYGFTGIRVEALEEGGGGGAPAAA